MITQEEWRPVLNYEGWYEASNYGEIRRMMAHGSTFVGKILKQSTNSRGYKQITLCKNGKHRTFTVHSLIMAAFVGQRPGNKQINHIDGDKTNNMIDNLEYVTGSENIRHAFSNKLRSQQGEKNANSKITEENVHSIRQLLGKETGRKIASLFNVSPATISLIATGKRWGSLKAKEDCE